MAGPPAGVAQAGSGNGRSGAEAGAAALVAYRQQRAGQAVARAAISGRRTGRYPAGCRAGVVGSDRAGSSRSYISSSGNRRSIVAGGRLRRIAIGPQ